MIFIYQFCLKLYREDIFSGIALPRCTMVIKLLLYISVIVLIPGLVTYLLINWPKYKYYIIIKNYDFHILILLKVISLRYIFSGIALPQCTMVIQLLFYLSVIVLIPGRWFIYFDKLGQNIKYCIHTNLWVYI